ncbi:MAG: YggT family protein [Candidatus Gastranaerophilaceae bacterium]
MIIHAINNLFYFFYILIIIRIFLTWIPTIDWEAQPIKSIAAATDWYLDIFKRIIPPFSGLDFSPIIALIALQIIQVILTGFLDALF